MKLFVRLLKETFAAWSEDNASIWAAALAFYSMLSLGPLLFIAISIVGLAFEQNAAENAILSQITNLMGPEAGSSLSTMLRHAHKPHHGILPTIFGLIILVFGASGVFAALQEAMNVIWNVRARPDAGIRMMFKRRFMSLSMVIGLGFLMIVSLALNGILAAIYKHIHFDPPYLLTSIEFLLTWGLIAGFLAGIFKILPDAQLQLRDVWLGAVATAIMLAVGETFIGIYLGRSGITTPFGAAGSLVVVLLWVYYAAQIVFIGAEWTRIRYQFKRGAIQPVDNAIVVKVVDVTDPHGRTQPSRFPDNP